MTGLSLTSWLGKLSTCYHLVIIISSSPAQTTRARIVRPTKLPLINICISKTGIRRFFVPCTAETARQNDPVTSLKRRERHAFSSFDLHVGELCWVFLHGGDDSSNWETMSEAARNQSVHTQVCGHWNGAKSLLVGQVSWSSREKHGINGSRVSACADWQNLLSYSEVPYRSFYFQVTGWCQQLVTILVFYICISVI